MPSDDHQQLFAGVRVTSLWTLLSRLLGMLRDMATAALLGASGTPVADAFVVAFRVPNLFRRLFGEGALAASYLPVFTAELEQDRNRAWRLASVVLTMLAGGMLLLVVLAELLLWGAVQFAAVDSDTRILLGLTATMLPYVVLICITAQLSAMLHALGRFALPAIVPTVLNIAWIVGAVVVAVRFENPVAKAYVLAGSVVVGGVLQLSLQIPLLAKLGFRFRFDWPAARDGVKRVRLTLLPMMFGLAIEQINTLLDSAIAWGLAGSPDDSQGITWLGGVAYPMEQGAAASLYYAARLYQFPIGLLGVAVATVIFPLLARHVGRGAQHRIGPDLSLGLQLVIFLAVPAGVGLMLIATPLTQLIFQRGVFSAEDTARTAGLVTTFATGVWAFCALPVVIRGYYAVGNPRTPLRVGMIAVAINLALGLLLVWPLAEIGLAAASVIAAAVQFAILLWLFARQYPPRGRALAATTGRSILATSIMVVACWLTLLLLGDSRGTGMAWARAGVPIVVGAAVYLAVYRLAGGREMELLLRRSAGPKS